MGSRSVTLRLAYSDRSSVIGFHIGTAVESFGGTCFISTGSSAPIAVVVTMSSSTRTCRRHGR